MNVSDTLIERGRRYGIFREHATVTRVLFDTVMEHALSQGTDLSNSQIEALHMICHKIGRIVNGDPNYVDSWIDIAGYATLVADELDGDAR